MITKQIFVFTILFCQSHYNNAKSIFKLSNKDVLFGCGIKKHLGIEETLYIKDNIVVSGGPKEIINPDDSNIKQNIVDYISTALIVKKRLMPKLAVIKFDTVSNYSFKIKSNKHISFEYMIRADWCEGPPLKPMKIF